MYESCTGYIVYVLISIKTYTINVKSIYAYYLVGIEICVSEYHMHNANYCYNESENQSVISHCSICGKITEHPIDEAIQASKGMWGN